MKIMDDAKLVKQFVSWEENDTGKVPMVVEDNATIMYFLFNVSAGGSQFNSMAVLIGDRWYELQDMGEADLTLALQQLLTKTFQQAAESGDPLRTEKLPTAGLENIRLPDAGTVGE